MAKPICVIYFPKEFSFGNGCMIIKPLDLMKEFNGWNNEGISSPREGFDEYLWFCFFKENLSEPEFQVFHEKDFTEVQYQELKELILENLKTNTNNK